MNLTTIVEKPGVSQINMFVSSLHESQATAINNRNAETDQPILLDMKRLFNRFEQHKIAFHELRLLQQFFIKIFQNLLGLSSLF